MIHGTCLEFMSRTIKVFNCNSLGVRVSKLLTEMEMYEGFSRERSSLTKCTNTIHFCKDIAEA